MDIDPPQLTRRRVFAVMIVLALLGSGFGAATESGLDLLDQSSVLSLGGGQQSELSDTATQSPNRTETQSPPPTEQDQRPPATDAPPEQPTVSTTPAAKATSTPDDPTASPTPTLTETKTGTETPTPVESGSGGGDAENTPRTTAKADGASGTGAH